MTKKGGYQNESTDRKGGDDMPRMPKKEKIAWNFFLNPDTGRKNYNVLCRHCVEECKQSFRAVVVECPKYKAKPGRK